MKIQSALLLSVVSLSLSVFAASDLELMNQARAAYEKNNLDKAIQIYSQVPKTSDFWIESLEEKAWAFTASQKYDRALAELKSATHPALIAQVGPESIMLSAYVSLKTCAYKDVVDKIQYFKKSMVPRVDALEKVMNGKFDARLNSYLNQIKTGKLNLVQLGKDAELYPRYFYRDVQVQEAARTKNILAAKNRLKVLAQADLEDIKLNLNKMKLMEIEVLQRTSMVQTAMNGKNLKFDGLRSNNQVSFPVDGDELWLDELGNYQVKAQGCSAETTKQLNDLKENL